MEQMKKNYVYKKIKLSPRSKDKINLFSRDFYQDEYLESKVNNVNLFVDKAYPNQEEKYFLLKFNQEKYENDRLREIAKEAAKKQLEANKIKAAKEAAKLLKEAESQSKKNLTKEEDNLPPPIIEKKVETKTPKKAEESKEK